MKIGVDATVLARRHKTGVDYYTRGLLRGALPHLTADDIDLCYFGNPGADLGVHGRRVRPRPIPWFSPRLYRALLKRAVPPPFDWLARTHADVWLFPDFVRPPLRRAAPSVVVVYDLSFELVPQFVARGNRDYLRRGVRTALQRATHVLTISASVAQEIVRHYGVSADRLTVAPPGVDLERFRPRSAADCAAVTERLGIDRPYVLFQGTLEPRKNIVGLVEAFERLPIALRRDHALVLAGRPGWLDAGIQARIARAQQAGCAVVTPGYVAEADLPALYSGARLFVYPSHYEGFGMPVLEAMACGTPVVTSRAAALLEVSGDAALHVEATDADALSAGMQDLLLDASRRDTLRQRGRSRAEHFRWETSGRVLASLLTQLATNATPATSRARSPGAQ